MSIGVGANVDDAWLSSIGTYYHPISNFALLASLVQSITAAACSDVDIRVDCGLLTAGVGSIASTKMHIINDGPYNFSNPVTFSVTVDAAGLQGLVVQPAPGSPPGRTRCRVVCTRMYVWCC